MLKLALLGAMLGAGSQAGALTLGPTQGSVYIGQPFDLLVSSRLAPGQSVADLCLQPQLLYGDAALPPASVSATLHRVDADGTVWLRVRSQTPVNEPIVTLHLQAGCPAQFRRSYTLLADWVAPAAPGRAPEALLPVLPPPVQAQGQVLQPEPRPDERAQPAELEPETPIRLAAPQARPALLAPLRSKRPPAPAPMLAAQAPPLQPPQPAPGARLVLEPLPATEAVALAAAQGAAAAPVAGPVALAPEAAARIATLEQELAALRAEQERLRVALERAQVPTQPAPAEAVGWPSAWLYGAAALALLLLGGLGYALRSGRWPGWRSGPKPPAPWWQGQSQANGLSPVPAPVPAQARTAAASAAPAHPVKPLPSIRPPTAASSPLSPAHAGGAEALASQHSWDALAAGPVHGLEVADGRASMFADVPVTPLEPGRLLAVWQQADAFESRGQAALAMQALAEYIQENPRASEAPYLRWLWLEAQSGAAPGLAARCYENHYLRLAPELEALARAEGLEHDAALLRSVQARWPLLPVRAVLKRALASQPDESQPGSLSVRTLAAFDDLLLLLALVDTLAEVASDEIDDQGLALPALGAVPAAAAAPTHAASASDPMLIDFDLSRLDAVSAEPPSAVAPPKPPAAG